LKRRNEAEQRFIKLYTMGGGKIAWGSKLDFDRQRRKVVLFTKGTSMTAGANGAGCRSLGAVGENINIGLD
jgi:hypothetical protein